jgi:hypothetical protein
VRAVASSLVGLSLALAACGGDDGETEANTTRTATGPAPKAEPLQPVLYGHDLDPAGPPTVRRGGLVTLFWYVSGGPVDDAEKDKLTVELWARAPGAKWRRVRSVKLGSGPDFRVHPRSTTTFQVRVAEALKARSLPLKIHVN